MMLNVLMQSVGRGYRPEGVLRGNTIKKDGRQYENACGY